MPSAQHSAGGPIEARCTKCRMNTNHTIIAVTDDGPAKVKCNTCEREHKYRPPTAPKKPAVRKTADPKIAEQKEWEGLRTEIEGKAATDYAMTKAFKVGNVVKHAAFGLGLVTDSLGPQKVEILFADGKKKMRCL